MQTAKMAEVIRAGAKGRGFLKDSHGKTCALGGLALAAGLKVGRNEVMFAEEALLELCAAYEVTDKDVLDNIPAINDHFWFRSARQEALIDYLHQVELGVLPPKRIAGIICRENPETYKWGKHYDYLCMSKVYVTPDWVREEHVYQQKGVVQ